MINNAFQQTKIDKMVIEQGCVQIESLRYYRSPRYSSLKNLNDKSNMYSAVKVLVFLFGIFIIPTILVIIPLYLRHKTFADVIFAVTESDVREIKDGISTLFCEAHTLKMNSSFNAFQINNQPINESQPKKHLRLRKSMTIPDDSLEYWGFFLNKGSIVNLSLCSRHEGGRIMIVKDISNFHTCGLLEQENKLKPQIHLNQDAIHITYESNENTNDEYEGENESAEKSSKSAPKPITMTQVKEYVNMELVTPSTRHKRSVNKRSPSVTHMEAILHGKTNHTEDEDSSVSSFEQTLLMCHNGRILFNTNFTYSNQCTNFKHLENEKHPRIPYKVPEDGYYFYIFYSDNDLISNEFYTIFDIWKPTYEYGGYVRNCVNQTECSFPLTMWSDEKVVVEIPTRNGIEHEIDDVSTLVSTCEPRTSLYSLFLVAVLISILFSAFIGSNTERRY